MSSAVGPSGPDTFSHCALLYHDDDEYLGGVLAFIAQGVGTGDPVIVAAPLDRHALLGAQLNGDGSAVELVDMAEHGRNPAQIIPAITQRLAAHAGRRLHYVGESIWPGRSAAEIAEATLHEALVNHAFPSASIRMLCPYDAHRLDAEVIEDAHRTHPHVSDRAGSRASVTYVDHPPPHSWIRPLAAPPAHAIRRRFSIGDLASLRSLVAEHAATAGLDRDTCADLVLAVDELASNSAMHGGGAGELRIWTGDGWVICEIRDAGQIHDPLVGRVAPAPASLGGRGLWLVNQLCGLVQIRTDAAGTTIRVTSR